MLSLPRLIQTMPLASSSAWTLTPAPDSASSYLRPARDLVLLWRVTTSGARATCRRDRLEVGPRPSPASASPSASSCSCVISLRCEVRPPLLLRRAAVVREQLAREPALAALRLALDELARAAARARSARGRSSSASVPSAGASHVDTGRAPGRAASRRRPRSSGSPRRCSSRSPAGAARRARRGSTRTRAPRLRRVRPRRCARSPGAVSTFLRP